MSLLRKVIFSISKERIATDYTDTMKLVISQFLIILFFVSCNVGKKEKASDLPEEFRWEYASPESQGFSAIKLTEAVNQLKEKNTKKLLIIRNDVIVYEWFAEGFEDSVRGHGTASLAKALIGGMSLLMAMNEGFIHPDYLAEKFIPSWGNDKLKSSITIRHLATHTSGIEDAEVSQAEQEKMVERGLHTHMDLPGWKGHFWRQDENPFIMARDSAPVLFKPGTKYAYSNPGIGMLTYAVTSSLRSTSYKDVRHYLMDKVYGPLGIEEREVIMGYRKAFETEELQLVPSWGGGTFTANATARIGRLMLNQGKWQGKQLIRSSMVKEVISYKRTPLPSVRRFESDPVTSEVNQVNPAPASTAGWYCNFDRVWKNIPPDAFCGGGAGNEHLFVVPSLNLIIVRYGGNLYDTSKGENFWLGAEKYLFSPVVEALED